MTVPQSAASPGGRLFTMQHEMPAEQLERHVLTILTNATRGAALACAPARGRRRRKFADRLAVEAMQEILNKDLQSFGLAAKVLIGEGERDDAPWLRDGQHLGAEGDPALFIAVDPLEGTNLCATNSPGAVCVIAAALAGEGALIDGRQGVDGYMEKLAIGEDLALALERARVSGTSLLDLSDGKGLLDNPVEEVVRWIAEVRGKHVQDVMVTHLDRGYNGELMDRLDALGVQTEPISDGDVTGALRAFDPGHYHDLLIGKGAAPEGVIAAAIGRCFGGYMEGRWWFKPTEQGDSQRRRLQERGFNLEKVYRIDELASGHVMFSITGVTSGLVPGVGIGDGGRAITSTYYGRSRTGTLYTPNGAIHRCPPPPPTSWPARDE